MRHLSPLELRVLRAVQEHPRMGAEPLARVVGETPAVVRSTLGVLRRFDLVERERIALIGYATYEITWFGEGELREWARRAGPRELLPEGVVPISHAVTTRARKVIRHG